jgi:hypothetical protein
LNSAGWGLWACKQGSNSDDVTTSMEVVNNGYIYLCGYYNNSNVTLGTTSGTPVTLTNTGGADGFAAKYNPNGKILWGIKASNTSDDRPKAIISDNNGYCYVMGNFFGTMTLGTLNPVSSLPTNIGTYIGRLNGFTTGFQEVKAPINFLLYPNPTTGNLTISSSVSGELSIYTIEGKVAGQYSITTGTNTIQLSSDLAAGVYLCRFTGIDGSTQQVRMVLQR